jgi:hypothetical protein
MRGTILTSQETIMFGSEPLLVTTRAGGYFDGRRRIPTEVSLPGESP